MDKTVLEQVVEGIAVAEGVNPENLGISIEHYVSTDAIRTLVNHESTSWRLQFETPQHTVEIAGNGTVQVDGESVRTYS